MVAAPRGKDYFHVEAPAPHAVNARRLLARHPEIRGLIGHNPWSIGVIAGLVAVQVATALLLARADAAWWVVLAAAWTIGALADHGLWVMIHEAGHNLVFARRWHNQLAGMAANLPILFPSYFDFARYHWRHHIGLGTMEDDPDLASEWEARLVGHGPLGKAAWLLLFPFVQGIRPFHLRPVQYVSGEALVSLAVQIAFTAAMAWLGGATAILYLVLSLFFSIGLHPLGARWIQEHYTLDPSQETFSYYGFGNRLAFNIGYHNEHHDFPSVPWNRLPRVTALAPEHYGALRCHRSWVRVLGSFLFDSRWSLFSRVLRPRSIRATAGGDREP